MELLPSARPPQRRRPRASAPRRPSARGGARRPAEAANKPRGRPRAPAAGSPGVPARAGGRRGARGLRAPGRLPAEAATALAFPRPAGPGPGNFPRLEPGQGDPQPSRGGRRGGERRAVRGQGGHRQRAGAQGDESQVWGCPGARGAITPEAGGSSALAGEAFRARRTGGLAREVGAGGQPWETRGPASYGDGRELRRVRKAGRCFRPSPFPPRRCSPPAPILTPLRAPRPAGETSCGWVQPSLRILLQTPQGRAEGNHRPPQPLPAQPRVFLATLPALRI